MPWAVRGDGPNCLSSLTCVALARVMTSPKATDMVGEIVGVGTSVVGISVAVGNRIGVTVPEGETASVGKAPTPLEVQADKVTKSTPHPIAQLKYFIVG